MLEVIDREIDGMRRSLLRRISDRRQVEAAIRRLELDNSFQSLLWDDDASR